MDFKQYILKNHPDPDYAMGDFDELCKLAENYAKYFHVKNNNK